MANPIWPTPYGQALVLNQRTGTDEDVSRLYQTFSSLGIVLFQNKAHINYEKHRMEAIIKEFANSTIHEKSSCAILVIMAHGVFRDQVVCYDNNVLKIDDIINWLSVQEGTETDIPKLLLFGCSR
jgi:hypothetical protein